MTRPGAARRCGWAALAASAAFALLTVAVLHAHSGPLPGDAALHQWSLDHRPAVAVALSRAITATGTGVIPFAAVVAAGLSVGRTPGSASPPPPDSPSAWARARPCGTPS